MEKAFYSRQKGLVDPAKLTQKIAIIGAGSVGSWTALCLGKLGCQNITVMDFDVVELHNVAPQIYKAADEDEPKTDALKQRLSFLLEEPISVKNLKWTPEEDLTGYDIVIAAVDNITNRAEIFEHLKDKDIWFLDPRMAGNGIQIFTAYMKNPTHLIAYKETLFPESETVEVPCSEKSVVYNVFTVAGMLGNLVGKIANKEELPREIVIDLKNLTLYK